MGMAYFWNRNESNRFIQSKTETAYKHTANQTPNQPTN